MSHPVITALLVGIGGAAGSLARYGVSLLAQRTAFQWPAGTFTVNVLGCFIIGIIVSLSERGTAISPEMRLALATGFCGGFTTMSSMIYETAGMMRSGEYLPALLYAGATLLLSMAAFLAGSLLIRLLLKHGGGLWN